MRSLPAAGSRWIAREDTVSDRKTRDRVVVIDAARPQGRFGYGVAGSAARLTVRPESLTADFGTRRMMWLDAFRSTYRSAEEGS